MLSDPTQLENSTEQKRHHKQQCQRRWKTVYYGDHLQQVKIVEWI